MEKGRNQTGIRKLSVVSALSISNFVSLFMVAGASVYAVAAMTEFNAIALFSLFFVVDSLFRTLMLPISAKLGNIYGRKKIYLIATALYIMGVAVCGMANSISVFMGFRVILSVAWGLFMTNSYTIMSDVYGEKSSGMMGIFSSLGNAGIIVGPIIAGIISNSVGWRMVFYAMIPLLAISFLLVFFGMKETEKTSDKIKDSLKEIILTVLAIGPLVLALNIGGSFIAWNSLPMVAMLICSAVFIVTLCIVEAKEAEPLFPIKLFRNRYYVVIMLIATLYQVIATSGNYFPLFMQNFQGMSTTLAASLSMPSSLVSLIIPTFAGAYLAKTKNYKRMTLIAVIALLGSSALFFTFNEHTPNLVMLLSFAIIGFAAGIIGLVPYAFSANEIKGEDAASGTAFIGFFQGIGNTVSAAFYGLIISIGMQYIFKIPLFVAVAAFVVFLVGFRKKNER